MNADNGLDWIYRCNRCGREVMRAERSMPDVCMNQIRVVDLTDPENERFLGIQSCLARDFSFVGAQTRMFAELEETG